MCFLSSHWQMQEFSPIDLTASCLAVKLEILSALFLDKNVSSSSVLNKKQKYPLNTVSLVSLAVGEIICPTT